MSDGTKIQWSEATWNPITGCTRVSEGCLRCYIERTPPFRMAGRRFDSAEVGGATGVVLHPERLSVPLRWRKPRRVFVNSLSDVFHDEVPDEFIERVFRVMGAARRHTFQLLTKRHARMRSLLSSPDFDAPWPLPNVWLGVSAENQQWLDIRGSALWETPAAVRWLSLEPLLGPVRLPFVSEVDGCTCYGGSLPEGHEPGCGTERGPAWGRLHWVVCGGESGPGARPCDPEWIRAIVAQCRSAGVPVFVKQLGSIWARENDPYGPGKAGEPEAWPEDLRVREYPV